ncbi:MAG: hypothetical protein Q4A98_03000 [Comamonadaceae bacterium]|nr:hypothetical protein [Comamonadaceae bacterium]
MPSTYTGVLRESKPRTFSMAALRLLAPQTQPRQQVHGIGHGVVLVLFSVSSPSNYFNQRKIYPISFKTKQGTFISF